MTTRRWSLLPFVAAVATAGVVAVLPVWTTTSCSTSPAGPMSCSSSSTSLLRAEGASVLFVLAVPVLLTLVPLAFPSAGSRTAIAAVLTLGMLVSLPSVGLFLLPTIGLAWLAVVANRGSRGGSGGHVVVPRAH